MISHLHKFIYCRIHKCANSTLGHQLQQHAAAKYFYQSRYLPARLDWALEQIARHIKAYPDYFAFMFVRNPFDRFVSFYQHGRRRLETGRDRGNAYFKDMRECAERVQFLLTEGMMLKVDRRDDRAGYWFCKHALPQSFYLLDGVFESLPKQSVLGSPYSFIGRVENLAEDFRCLEAILKLPQHPLKHYNLSLQREAANRGVREHYGSYYDKSLRALVEDIYARDLALFKYEFEDLGKVHRVNPLYEESKVRRIRETLPRLSLCQWGKMCIARLQVVFGENLLEVSVSLLENLASVKGRLGIRYKFPAARRLVHFLNEWKRHHLH